MGVEDMVNEGVRRAYNHPDNKLRASVLADPAFSRRNTKDNTPAVINVRWCRAMNVEVIVAAKGGGSENKSKFAMLNPSDSIVDWVLKTVPTMGAGWCPPGMLGIGIGGTAEKAMLLAKESLMDAIDMPELKARGPQKRCRGAAHRAVRQGQRAGHRRAGPGRPDHGARREDLRLPDPRGEPAGGDDSELRRHPSRALRARRQRAGRARSAVAGRLAEADLDGRPARSRVNLDTVTREVASWKPGEVILLLTGKLLTGRDAAHKRMTDMLRRAKSCRSTSPTASSTTSARSTRFVTKWWARPARPPRRAWTSSPSHDAGHDRPDRHGRQEPSAARRRSTRSRKHKAAI
jgi:fumarate hydratase, class I